MKSSQIYNAQKRTGFLLHVFQQSLEGRTTLFGIGKSNDGLTFGLVDKRVAPSFFVREADIGLVRPYLSQARAMIGPCGFANLQGEPLASVQAPQAAAMRRLVDRLEAEGIQTCEGDIPLPRRYCMDRRLHGPVQVTGIWQPGREVDWVAINPDVRPADHEPALALLSLDIETTPDAGEVTAVALVGVGPEPRHGVEEVLVHGVPHGDDPPQVCCHGTEKALLKALTRRIREIDPDILTGWNVIDFDMQVLQKRCHALGMPFVLGRTRDVSFYRPGSQWGGSRMTIHGRQVLDAMQLTRYTLTRYDDYHLDTVARSVLGRGKLLDEDTEHGMPEQIDRAFRENRSLFCEYCLEDARLVRDILDKEDLIRLTLRRAVLTGLPLDRAWGSVAAFEFLYISQLHRRRLAAPTTNTNQPVGDQLPGGWVFVPRAGMSRNVMVFDFKSLYPSIMRTFNIDPLTHLRAAGKPEDQVITAPNGATFDRRQGILPGMLDVFFDRRARAKAEGNALASYTYKIVMNSFYGVLGTPGCRFSSARIAGAITRFGQYLLKWSRAWLEEQAVEVLYGDTDSLFVDMHLPEDIVLDQALQLGADLRDRFNRALDAHVENTYRVTSRLELEFEKFYRRFLVPPMRGQSERGRAKGYAGLIADTSGERLEIVGMEAVRRDWTEMAHAFQRQLLERLFRDTSACDIEVFIRNWIADIKAGRMDDMLVYRRGLRKPVSAYTRTTPPHVKAARMLPRPSGVIRYVMTVQGPQPVGYVQAPLDYAHYIEKQVEPIVKTVAAFCGINPATAISGEQWLF